MRTTDNTNNPSRVMGTGTVGHTEILRDKMREIHIEIQGAHAGLKNQFS